MSVKTDNIELNERINSRNVHAQIEKRDYAPFYIGHVSLSNDDYEVDKMKENACIAVLISIIFSLIGLFLIIVFLYSFLTQSQQTRVDFTLIGVLVAFLFIFIKTFWLESNRLENAFSLYEDDIKEHFDESISFVHFYSTEQKRKELFYLFVEHFCKNFNISEYSDLYEIAENRMEIKDQTIDKALRTMVEDSRYISIKDEVLKERQKSMSKTSRRWKFWK